MNFVYAAAEQETTHMAKMELEVVVAIAEAAAAGGAVGAGAPDGDEA